MNNNNFCWSHSDGFFFVVDYLNKSNFLSSIIELSESFRREDPIDFFLVALRFIKIAGQLNKKSIAALDWNLNIFFCRWSESTFFLNIWPRLNWHFFIKVTQKKLYSVSHLHVCTLWCVWTVNFFVVEQFVDHKKLGLCRRQQFYF